MPGQNGAALHRLEGQLAEARAQMAGVIMEDQNLSTDERGEWRRNAQAMLDDWQAFRTAHCDDRLMRFEGRGETAAALECRAALTRVMLGDLSFRYQLDEHALPRASVDTLMAKLPAPAEDDTGGPCGNVDPGACDYCGANKCWEARLAENDGALNTTWKAVLATIAAKPLPAAERAQWTEKLRVAQRAWLAWRDATCALESWETPNRFAHSIYSGQLAPCIDGETVARVRWLRRTYRLRG